MSENVGKIVGISGNLITVRFEKPVTQSEVGYARAGAIGLKSEVIRIRGENAELQVFEDTTGLKVGDPREVDHKLPISQGGTNSHRNLRAVRQATNRHKGSSANKK